MAPRKRRGVGRLGGPATLQTFLDKAQAVNTRGLHALAHEILLEIISHIPSIPIPTPITSNSELYPEIRRSRHEILLSLSQTSRSLRRFFWRYLWQRIEVREGMKTGDGNDTLEATQYLGSSSGSRKAIKYYAIELVRQLEIVTVRNPQLAQYVNYIDVFIGDYSIDTVLAELARCLSLFPNLHTIQIDVISYSRRSLGKIFDRVFKEHSYPHIRNLFFSSLSQSLISSCPETRHVGFTQGGPMPLSCLRTIVDNCPRLEILEEPIWRSDTCKLIVDSFPHLRTITIIPVTRFGHIYQHQIDVLKRLNHLQTIIILWKPVLIHARWLLSPKEQGVHLDRMKEEWIELIKRILIEIQLRNNLEKIVVVRDDKSERKILIPPVEKKVET